MQELPGGELTIVIPCYNEEGSIAATRSRVRTLLDRVPGTLVIVVDDGSTDGSRERLEAWERDETDIRIVRHNTNRGYGAALKTGIRQTQTPLVAIVDLDGSYPLEDLPRLLAESDEAELVVGARTGKVEGYPVLRRIPKFLLRKYVEWLVGETVPDFNSGFRVMKTGVIRPYLRLFPDGFSFTTSSTVAMLSDGHRVRWVPIDYAPRVGESKIRPIRDTLNFFKIVLRTGVYFAPLRTFLPVAFGLFGLFTISFGYDVFALGNLTDKTVLLLLFSLNTFLFSLLADMIRRAIGQPG